MFPFKVFNKLSVIPFCFNWKNETFVLNIAKSFRDIKLPLTEQKFSV